VRGRYQKTILELPNAKIKINSKVETPERERIYSWNKNIIAVASGKVE
jgi:hypothetical protein